LRTRRPTDQGKTVLKCSVTVAQVNFDAELVAYRYVKLAIVVEVRSYHLESS
jgi:hypothetical protein